MDKTQPHIPIKLPPKDIDWKRLIPFIGKVHAAIARYDGLLQSLINPAVLLSPLTTKEAVLSSRIEGTQASLEEVLEVEAGLDKEKPESIKQDIQEIINYRKALLLAEEALAHRSITLHFIKQIHAILMESVRGKNKNPGEFRKEQNWIGIRGTPMEQARFIPPNPMLVDEFMEDLVKFIQTDFADPIVQLAIVHAQFEIIHPFRDGNGRIGRLLIPLFLYSKKILSRPMFYISEYLESHRKEYYDQLFFVTEKNDWQGWIEFFINAAIEQAEINYQKAKDIVNLYEKLKPQFIEKTHSQFAIPLLDAFFEKPILDSTMALKIAHIPNRVTGNALLKKLDAQHLITLLKAGQGRKPNIYALANLINIIEGKKIL